MASEVEWRRKWRPGLAATPWQPLSVTGKARSSSGYLLKHCFTQDSYEVLVTDLTSFWYEQLDDSEIKKRVKKLNPGLEASLTRILDQIQGALEKAQEGKDSSLKINFKEDPDADGQKMMMTVKSSIAGMPFTWNFICKPAEKSLGSKHLILPLMTMVGELTRRQQELIKLVQNKDKEIEDYKSQGVKTSRKHIETIPFVETAFEMNMMTSKGFESQVQESGISAFNSDGQDLYRQIMTKRAWITRSPGKEAEEADSLTDDIGTQDSHKRSLGQSWGTARLPPSLVSNKSPTKASQKRSPSPSKSPHSSKSTPDVSPTKDSELLRRQALERRLEMEEQKKQEKSKKKKKIAF